MSHKHRRRSRSRDISRKRGSYDRNSWRSVSRSGTISRSRRSISRSRKTSSRERRNFSKERKSLSRSRSVRRSISSDVASKRDRKRYSADSDAKGHLNRFAIPNKRKNERRPYLGRRMRGIAQPMLHAAFNNMMPMQMMQPFHQNMGFQRIRSSRRYPMLPIRGFKRGSNKCESEEFRNQREKNAELAAQKEKELEENQKLMADYTTKLNSLIAEFSSLPKDTPQKISLSDQIKALKVSMKELNVKDNPAGPKPPKMNKIDNRETRLLFRRLPDCARGKGNLARWISENAKILLPKQIAMLATQGVSEESTIIQYKSHEIAEMVLNSCKLHGIAVCWMQNTQSNTENENKPAEVDEKPDVCIA